MKYREDPDLDFLKDCTSEELNILVEVLLHNKDGQQRSIVQLPNHPLYKQYAPHHVSYWEVIAGEIQRYGSNPLAALARAGRGKHYIKILDDVCSRFGVRYLPGASVDIIERDLYMHLFTRVIPHISQDNLHAATDILAIKPNTLNAQSISQALQEAMRLNDQLGSLVAMTVAHGAAMHASGASYAELAPETLRPLLEMFEKPLALELEAVSPLSFTGSAHWIIIPAVLQLAYLRAKKNAENLN